MGGTYRVIVDNTTTGPTSHDNQEMQPKSDRLYATVDEFLFGAHNLNATFGDPGYVRWTNNQYASHVNFSAAWQTTPPPINPQLIDKLRFFLTTQSRAPELNLWGQPRVACWPVRAETNSETTGLNLFDNLMLFCSTVGSSTAATNLSTGRTDSQTDYTASGLYRYLFTRREVVPATNTSAVSHPDLLEPYQHAETMGIYRGLQAGLRACPQQDPAGNLSHRLAEQPHSRSWHENEHQV